MTTTKHLCARKLMKIECFSRPHARDPRVPAVLMRFPRTFSARADWPKEVLEVVERLESGENGTGLEGIPLAKHKFWIDFIPNDGRVTNSPRKKIKLSVSLESYRRIVEQAKLRRMSRGEWLDTMLAKAL